MRNSEKINALMIVFYLIAVSSFIPIMIIMGADDKNVTIPFNYINTPEQSESTPKSERTEYKNIIGDKYTKDLISLDDDEVVYKIEDENMVSAIVQVEFAENQNDNGKDTILKIKTRNENSTWYSNDFKLKKIEKRRWIPNSKEPGGGHYETYYEANLWEQEFTGKKLELYFLKNPDLEIVKVYCKFYGVLKIYN